ncbi:hypothetical protein ElyMa_002757800 [Elysia marginata]|uniref:Helix-turn-helix domain-containing protein n=1 Tax=Elysia marginata TaxID=1093978 RepID=A0AAV4HKM9_9GAST|nr:hypothetical protein ElyMa_002757800 [Elysia marginata]
MAVVVAAVIVVVVTIVEMSVVSWAKQTDKSLVWLRYIDNILLIWTHGRAKLEAFIANANTFHPTIKFTSSISDTQIPFLDVMVSLQNNTLHTDLYSKLTDTFNYLHWSSCLPFHTKSSIPYSLAFRLIRICSCEETLIHRLTELTEHLKRRGFPLKLIQKAIHKAKEIPRSTAIQRCRLPETQKDRIPFVITYNPALPIISSILKNTSPFSIYHLDVEEQYPTSQWQPSIHQKNLWESLVHANLQKAHICGNRPCNIRRCLTCRLITTASQFTSTVTGKTYNILHNLSCDSYNIIYLIACTKCKKQSVGLTPQTLRKRFNTHRSNFNNQRGDTVGLLLNLPEHDIKHDISQLQVTPVDQLKKTRHDRPPK